MVYKLVIFDFDGTLANSFPWFLGVMGDVAARYKFRAIDATELEAIRGFTGRQLLDRLGLPAWKVPLVAAHMRRLQGEHAQEIGLFDGVDAMLAALAAAGVTLAIVSSNSEANVRRVLGPANAARIAHFACSASLFGKARKIRSVLKRSGVAAAEAICIGDEVRDIDAARAAGTATGAVTWGYARADVLRSHAPTETFTSVAEVADRLTRGRR